MSSLLRLNRPNDMRTLQREIDSVFESFFPTARTQESTWTPRTDITETETIYGLHLDAPGLSKDAFELNVHEGTLTVSGERVRPARSEGEDASRFVRAERSFGTFSRAFALPKDADLDGISASYDAGVLSISIRKTEESKPRQIAVN